MRGDRALNGAVLAGYDPKRGHVLPGAARPVERPAPDAGGE